jgi:hypothetical protein
MEGNVSFLRKQESRLLCACTVFLLGKGEIWKYVLDCRFRGSDT